MRTWARVFCSIRLTGKQNPIKYASQPVGDKCVWLYGAMWPGMARYGVVWHGVPGSLSWHCASIKVFSCTNGSTLINMLQNALLRCVIPPRFSHVCACMYTCVCVWYVCVSESLSFVRHCRAPWEKHILKSADMPAANRNCACKSPFPSRISWPCSLFHSHSWAKSARFSLFCYLASAGNLHARIFRSRL